MAEHFEGVKSTGAEVILPAFTFGCQTGAPQGPLYPGLNPQLQVLLAGIALQIPANRLFCSSPPSRRGYPRDGEKLRGPGGICGHSFWNSNLCHVLAYANLLKVLTNHRIPDWAGLGGTLKLISLQLPAFHQTRLLGAPSSPGPSNPGQSGIPWFLFHSIRAEGTCLSVCLSFE